MNKALNPIISLFYPIPTLGWLPLLLVPHGIRLYAAVVALYLLAALLTGLRSLRIKMALAVAAGIVSTHIVYGLFFIKGLLTGKKATEQTAKTDS